MGFNSVVLILNDAIGDIDRNLPQWWEGVKRVISRSGTSRGGDRDVSAGGFINASTLLSCHHADETSVIAVGGNCGTILHHVYFWRHNKEADQVKLLRELAEKLGYEIQRKPGIPFVSVVQWSHGQMVGLTAFAKSLRPSSYLTAFLDYSNSEFEHGRDLSGTQLLGLGLNAAVANGSRFAIYAKNTSFYSITDEVPLVAHDLVTGEGFEVNSYNASQFLRARYRQLKVHPGPQQPIFAVFRNGDVVFGPDTFLKAGKYYKKHSGDPRTSLQFADVRDEVMSPSGICFNREIIIPHPSDPTDTTTKTEVWQLALAFSTSDHDDSERKS